MDWLHHDHAQFESAVNRCSAACEAEDWESLEGLLAVFVADYRAHVDLEEGVLFPTYERLASASKTPTESLKSDHSQLFSLMEEASRQVEARDARRAARAFGLLFSALAKHHEKEEELFLPMASDALLSSKDEVKAALRAYLTERRTRD